MAASDSDTPPGQAEGSTAGADETRPRARRPAVPVLRIEPRLFWVAVLSQAAASDQDISLCWQRPGAARRTTAVT
ncbi:hypothetical protein OG427_38010 [Streptomyces sp. NBC_00133]|uniref:hypothetical protein n=1 Tax=Streptomyces sp. NBC_00133 TaxID=2903624 RepID=UPI0032436C46